MHVYVLDINGNPLMPCKPAKARHLLEANKAVVAQRTPFTIRLTFEVDGYVDDVTLGVDAGSKTIGLSAVTNTKELYACEYELRNDIVDKLATRREMRRARRSRLRYRKPRFDNRKRKPGWLAPSVQHKVDCHVKAVTDVCKILPIAKIVVEIAQFDIQKIKNPSIEGEEYQHGELEGWNVREYVLYRDDHKCVNCKGKSKDDVLQVHHIESRKIGGNAPNNLVTLCKTCHEKYHAGEIELKVVRGTNFRDAAFMNIMRWAVYTHLKEVCKDVSLTYGYITKHERISYGLVKSHAIDARVIADGTNVLPDDTLYRIRKVRRNNRQINKANKLRGNRWKRNQAAKYVYGFQLFDKVIFDNHEYFVHGRRTRGYFSLKDMQGNSVLDVSYKKLTFIEHAKGMLSGIERREPQFLSA